MQDKAVHYDVALRMKEVGILRLADHGHHYNKDWHIPFEYCYDPSHPAVGTDIHIFNWEVERDNSTEERVLQLIKAPYQSSLQNWLREYQGIDIEIIRTDENQYRTKVGKDSMRSVTEDRKTMIFEEYYDAMDAALLQALSLLPEYLV